MKKLQILLFLIIPMVLMNCDKKPEGADAKTGDSVEKKEVKGNSMPLNLEKSSLRWTGRKVTMNHTGTVKIKEGNVVLDGDKITGGKVVIDMSTIVDEDLTNPEYKNKLETHLKSEDFFDIEKFPTSTFEIVTVTDPTADGSVNITGNLEIRGISKSITVPAKIEIDENKKPTAASTKFNIDRTDWGIVYKGMADDLIANEVNFDLKLSL
ncbi:MAG: YceI family protein [Leptospiraceae bacterium]|nr:YceI family protein [Leptospiraceae bacterium]